MRKLNPDIPPLPLVAPNGIWLYDETGTKMVVIRTGRPATVTCKWMWESGWALRRLLRRKDLDARQLSIDSDQSTET